MNDFTRLTAEQGFHVYGWMRTQLGLSGTELAIFAIVYSYTQNGGEGVGGNRFFMEWTGASKDTVIRSLKKLTNAGLIEAVDKSNGQLNKYKLGVVANCNQSQNATGSKMQPVAKCNHHQSQNATAPGSKMQPATKIESKQERKLKINNNTTVDNNNSPREEEPPQVQASMQPPEAPKFHEVYNAMRNMVVRPIGTELEKCAHAFYDLREQQGWSGNWKSHASRYAASWAAKVRNMPPQREKPRPCKPDDPVQDFGEIPW